MEDYTIPFLQNYAVQTAQDNQVDPNFVLAQITQESSWNPNAQSPTSSAYGLGQCITSTCAELGVDLSDPLSQIHGVVDYDSQLLAQCNGDYTCVGEKYGTLPTSGPYSTGQQTVAQAAQAANGGTFNASNAACLAQSAASLGMMDFTSCFGSNAGSDNCASLDFICKIKSSGLNLLSIIVGLILVTAGLFMLKSGSSAGDTIIAAHGAVRDALTDAVVA